MSERRKGGWWRYPGAPVRVVLAFTAAGLVVIALLLALTCFLPKKGYVGGPVPDDPLKAMAEALKGIKESLSATRDLSITVKLDKDQWKEIDKRLQNLTGIGKATETGAEGNNATVSSVEDVSGKVDAIADSVKEVAGNTCRIATKVEKISNETGAIADSVKNIAARTKGMARPWACESSECLGAVHFPHDWPERGSIYADGECGKWEGSGNEEPIPEPICRELKEIVYKLPSPPPPEVWVVGHASTLGTEPHNDDLSKRRTKFVVDRLEEEWGDKWGNNVHFKTCAVGERGSADSLRHPDAWYRVVQVFAQKPQALTENPAWWWCSE